MPAGPVRSGAPGLVILRCWQRPKPGCLPLAAIRGQGWGSRRGARRRVGCLGPGGADDGLELGSQQIRVAQDHLEELVFDRDRALWCCHLHCYHLHHLNERG